MGNYLYCDSSFDMETVLDAFLHIRVRQNRKIEYVPEDEIIKFKDNVAIRSNRCKNIVASAQ